MNSVIAAVAVTLVVNTADDKVSSSDGVLSCARRSRGRT